MENITQQKYIINTDPLGRVTVCEAMRLANCSRWTLRRLYQQGRFPRPIAGLKRGEKQLWAYDEVLDWACRQPGSKFFRNEQ